MQDQLIAAKANRMCILTLLVRLKASTFALKFEMCQHGYQAQWSQFQLWISSRVRNEVFKINAVYLAGYRRYIIFY